jgi:hypothetical protein
MTDKENIEGIGFTKTTDDEKKIFAKNSLEWNKKNELFKEIFSDFDNLNLI